MRNSLIITGDEQHINPREPEGALAEFYRAYNSRDIQLMEANWAHGDEPSSFHTLGGKRRGWAEIKALYEQTFYGVSGAHVTFHDVMIDRFGDTFITTGVEKGLLRSRDATMAFRARTSRLFGWRGGRWRQLHHHGSIEEPESLAQYLTLVVTGKLLSQAAA